MEEIKIQQGLEVLKQVKINENLSLDDIQKEYERISNIFDNLSDDDYAEIISFLCKKYSKEQLAEMLLKQMIELKFNSLNLSVYKTLNKTLTKSKERLNKIEEEQREVYYIINNEILTDKKIISNFKDIVILKASFINNLTNAIKYPVKIKLSNYEFSEYTRSVILDKLKNYINIID